MKTLFTTIFICLLSATAFADIPEPVEELSGDTLYQQNCSRCHGKLEKTSVPDRRPGRIASAIRTIGPMAKLNHLSAIQVIEISKALATSSETRTSR